MRAILSVFIASLLTLTACEEAPPPTPDGSYALDVEAMLAEMDEQLSTPAAPLTETQAAMAEDFKSKMLGMFKGLSATLQIRADKTFEIPVTQNGVLGNTYSGTWSLAGDQILLQGEATVGPGMNTIGTLQADGIHCPNGFADIRVPVVFRRK